MKLKYEFVINNVAGSAVAVPVGKNASEFKGYIKLNDTGAFIFKALMKNSSKEEIVKGLIKEFSDVTEQEAVEAVDSFFAELTKAGVTE